MKTRMATGGTTRYLLFWCPGCDEAHSVPVTGPMAWGWQGSRETPTLNPSILVRDTQGSVCHSFVRDGQIQFLGDCTHALVGQTVLIPEWPKPDFGGLDPECDAPTKEQEKA